MKGAIRSTLVVSILVAFLLTSAFSFAGQMNQSVDIVPGIESCEMSPSQPDFLADTEAVALTSKEMGEVKGTFLPWLVWQAFTKWGVMTANYLAELYGFDMRFSLLAPLCVGEDLLIED